MGVDQFAKRSEQYLGRLEHALGSTPASSRRVWERLLDEFLAVAEAPSPEAILRPLFCHPAVLTELAEALFVPYREDLREAIERVTAVTAGDRRASYYRARQLSPLGSYPNVDVLVGRGTYLIRHGVPYLITVNSGRQEAAWRSLSEVSDWTRHETRLAAAIATTEWGGFAPYLSSASYDVPVDRLAHVDPAQRAAFLVEFALLRQWRRYHQGQSERPSGDGPYEYWDFSPHLAGARSFAAGFLVSHPLLLRTARLFVKATMLWRTDGMAEDAVATLFFSLEGCLLLFQEVAGGREDRLDRRLLRAEFDRVFDRGTGLFDFIQDAMGWGGTRARLVHPQLSRIEGWQPFVMADDYYEYNQIVRALLK